MVKRDFNALVGEMYIGELYDSPEDIEAKLRAELMARQQNIKLEANSVYEPLDLLNFDRYRRKYLPSKRVPSW